MTWPWSHRFHVCTAILLAAILLAAILLAAILLAAIPATPASGAPRATPKPPLAATPKPLLAATPQSQLARSVRLTSINDRSKLHRVQVIGNTLVEEGKAEGTLRGRIRIRLDFEAERDSATSQFAIYLPGGDLLGHARGRAATGRDGWESFGGEMWIDRGTSRYAHASGSGKMYGALNRHSDILVVQVTGHAQGL